MNELKAEYNNIAIYKSNLYDLEDVVTVADLIVKDHDEIDILINNIAVPTLTICILSGYFIGFLGGFLAALSGTSAAGIVGYLICQRYGDRILPLILKDN